MPECYIRGTNVKYLRIPDEVMQLVKDDQTNYQNRDRGNFRGGRGGGRGAPRGHFLNFVTGVTTSE